ncbi:MAG: hypothetical protein ACRECE_05255 [Xanthobacteraceae bacterium]
MEATTISAMVNIFPRLHLFPRLHAFPRLHSLVRVHFLDRKTVARINAAILLGLVVSGLAACMLGASVYDIGRLFSAW